MTAVRTLRVVLPARERHIAITAPSGDAWLTQAQAARHIGVSVATLSNYTNRDENPVPAHCPSANTVRYSRAELDEWLRSQPGRSVAS
jgi:predicted DNA-binding transcriptional regulator AlpA